MPLFRKRKKRKSKSSKPQKMSAARAARSAQRKVNSLLYQMDIQKKLNRMSVANIFYGAKNINELETNSGNVVLRDSYTHNELPLVMLSLRSIRNGSNTPAAIMKLMANGYDFTQVNSVDQMGTSGASADQQPNSGADYRNLLHRYTQIKLLLWQSGNADAKFQVSLVRLLDPELDPLNTGYTTTDSQTQDKRSQFYRFHNLRAQMSNPLIANTENFTRDMKRCFQILWKKTYHLEEQTTLKDQKHYRQINIFKKFDKIINYCQNPKVNVYSSFDDPSNIVVNASPDIPKGVPQQTRDNLFLIITGNCTRSEDEDASNYDTRSLDIFMKSKYTTALDQTFS